MAIQTKILRLGFLGLMTLLVSCSGSSTNIEQRPLFQEVYKQKKEHSDKKALKIAFEVMDSSGGYDNWKKARYLNWIFFNARRWIWDKKTGDVRVYRKKDSLTVMMNLNSREGTVFKGDRHLTNPDTVQKYVNEAYKMWANDSYWVFMPFKLIDPGVRLQYKGEEVTPTEVKSDVIRVSFDSVGVTPKNFYDIYVSKETRRVCFWDYYPSKTYADKKGKPYFSLPWTNYREFKGLKIALNHGGKNKITGVSVRDSINRAVFKELNPYDAEEKKEKPT